MAIPNAPETVRRHLRFVLLGATLMLGAGLLIGGAWASESAPRPDITATSSDVQGEATPRPAATAAMQRPNVVVIGDSLVEFAEHGSPLRADRTPTRQFTRAAAGRNWQLQVVGHHGWTTADLLGDLRRHGRDADAVIVVAGANDAQRLASGQATPDEVQGWVDEALHALRGVRCVVWATVTTTAGPTIYWPSRDAPELVNALIAERSSHHPNVRVVDWATADDDRALLLADGLHHTVAGEAALAERLTAAAADCLQSRLADIR